MKQGISFLLCALLYHGIYAQVISHFEFNSTPVTTASTGPNATSADPDAVINSGAGHIGANCNASKGLDLVVPTGGGSFDVPSLCMSAIFQRDESIADFFNRGNTRFWIDGGEIRLQYMTTVSGTPTMNGPFLTGHVIPNDNTFRTYTFCYDHITGVATITVDGVTVFSHDGVDNAPLNWIPTDNIIIGKNMDGNCNGRGVLDDFTIFIPAPLAVTLSHTDAFRQGGSVVVEWSTASEVNADYFGIERSSDGMSFTEVGRVTATGNSTTVRHYSFTDPTASNGTQFYRIRMADASGATVVSRVMEVTAEDAGEIISVYPNPTLTGLVNINFSGELTAGTLRIMDVSGKEVQKMEISQTNGVTELDLSGYGKGIYFIEFNNGTIRKVVKIFYQYSSSGKRVKAPK